MADKQKRDPGKAFLHLPRVLYFCVLYHIGSQKVVIWGQKAIYRGFSKLIPADWSGPVTDEQHFMHNHSSVVSL